MVATWILGSGGHAKVVIDTIRSEGKVDPVGILDDDVSRLGSVVLGVRVQGSTCSEELLRLNVTTAVIAIGGNQVRQELAHRLHGQVTWCSVVHPSSVISSSAGVGDGTVVFAGAVIQPEAIIGRHVIVNTSSSIDHDCTIGDYVHIAPGVHLAGNVVVEEGAFLVIGSVVLPGRRIGAWATVGAGAVVTRDVPAGATAVGAPARWKGSPWPEERRGIE